MAFSEANNVTIRYSRETAWGEAVDSPATTQLRVTGESFAHTKETVVSNEIENSRQRTAILEVGASANGGFQFEMIYGEYEAFFETSLRGTIASATHAIASCTIAASSITRDAGNFLTGFAVGQWVKSNANSGEMAKITALTSTVLTCVGTTLTAGVVSTSITGRTLVNGTTKTSYFVETDFGGISAVKYQTGHRVNTFNLSVASSQIVTGGFEFMGKQGFTASATVASAVVVSAGTNTPMTAAANVAKLLADDATLAPSVNSITIDGTNNMSPRPSLGTKFSAEPVDGGLDVTGSVNMYFDRIEFYSKMINHTAFGLDFAMVDVDDNAIIVSLPSCIPTGGDPFAGGKDADVFLDLAFQARKDPTLGYTCRMDFLPV